MKPLSDIIPATILARENTESPIEVLLFDEMMRHGFVLCGSADTPTGAGYFLFPQHHVGPYRADFIIRMIGYPSGARVWPPRLQSVLCVECDGDEFHRTAEQKEYDAGRDRFFHSHGIPTLRFSGSLIHKNASFCVDEIVTKLWLSQEKIS